jgi:DnaJ-class molecular chaperone
MELENGEIICDRCNGTGRDPDKKRYKSSPWAYRCSKCNANGKISWLQNIITENYHPTLILKSKLSQLKKV